MLKTAFVRLLLIFLLRIAKISSFTRTSLVAPTSSFQLSPRYNKNSVTSYIKTFQQKEASYNAERKIDRLKAQLTSSGRSGLLAYGALNCLYYTIATAIAWNISLRNFRLAPSVSLLERIGLVFSRLGSVSVVVWAGSQVTKLFRLSGAVIMAPAVDKLLQAVQNKMKLKDQNAAFWFLIWGLWITFASFYISFILIGTSVSYI
jgi:hypothetical protein